METDPFYLAEPDGQIWTELSQTRQCGGCREEPAGEAVSLGIVGPLQTDLSGATEPDWNRIGNNGEESLAYDTGGRGYSELAVKYQFTDHLAGTRFVAGTRWPWGTGDTCLETAAWRRLLNLTPYGGAVSTWNPVRGEMFVDR